MNWPQAGVVCAVILAAGCSLDSKNRVCIENQCVTVELAENEEDRARGLQNRVSLARDAGMLFVFPRDGRYPFWMKDTLIPLDIIWIDASQRVVYIEDHVPPCREDPCPSYKPRRSARYVLEVNAGDAAQLGIKEGQWLEFRLNALE